MTILKKANPKGAILESFKILPRSLTISEAEELTSLGETLMTHQSHQYE